MFGSLKDWRRVHTRAAEHYVLHRTRSILIRQRIQISNAIRHHVAEFGMAAAVGRQGLQTLINVVEDSEDPRIPAEARDCLAMLATQLRLVNEQILDADQLGRMHDRPWLV